ncbi:acyl-CoA dehydrogenase [Marinobacterium weihaiense]|uniref:Acyl-CoA dehydrogenase n=1 Tax=Marinobacterium weihaiense TaxID=2851016 RepID=A0ABS6MBA9_9GAMM|nr:acyl-CoA dehydrogenase [Marinobacterium weihaiense]MBV0933591.1 acyl-CoA dehydrogenase [Marinobacterium weihaiense]
MNEYLYPAADMRFVLQHLIGFDRLCRDCGQDAVDQALADEILAQAGRFAQAQLVPLNPLGDQRGCRMGPNGAEPPGGFAQAHGQFVAAGWHALTLALEWGGQGLPRVLGAAVNEIWQSANMAFSLCPLLTEGAMETLVCHGSTALKQRLLPAMAEGRWSGTMNLTEPEAGSDLAAIRTRAEPCADGYRLFGQKIYITWGEHDMTDNIVHLVLARLPDAPPGVKGISMFAVPRYLPDAAGEWCLPNDVRCLSLEHKLGIHASPTCVMSYGEQGGALGYLVGAAHEGLAQMFTMMNSARQAVGLQGVAIAERACQQARAYACARLQGTAADGTRFAIVRYPDVRRMLMQMRASIEAMRALAYRGAADVDNARCLADRGLSQRYHARADLLTPIIKGWCTELAQEVVSQALQIHGGMGYIEETGVAQHLRDARILTIYEGTTGIQGLDLVGRKLLHDRGAALEALLDEIDSLAERLSSDTDLAVQGARLAEAVASARIAQAWLIQQAPVDPAAAGAASVPLLMLLGYLCGGWVMGLAALQARAALALGQGDEAFLHDKCVTARFYSEHLLPRTRAALESVLAGSDSIMAIPEQRL